MFFRAKSGDTYPISAITRMETPYREGHAPVNGPFSTVIVWLGNEQYVPVHQIEIDRIGSLPITSFPAAPETYLVSVVDEEIQRQPIIGWVVSQSEVRPILVHGVFDDSEESWVVQTPDGSVNDEHAGHWPDLASYKAYSLRRADAA